MSQPKLSNMQLICRQCRKRTRQVIDDKPEPPTVAPCPFCDPNGKVEQFNDIIQEQADLMFPEPPIDFENEYTNRPATASPFRDPDEMPNFWEWTPPECPHSSPIECRKFTNEQEFPIHKEPPYLPTTPFYFPVTLPADPNAPFITDEEIKRTIDKAAKIYGEGITRGRNLGETSKLEFKDGTTLTIEPDRVRSFEFKLNNEIDAKRAEIQKIVNILSTVVRRGENALNATFGALRPIAPMIVKHFADRLIVAIGDRVGEELEKQKENKKL